MKKIVALLLALVMLLAMTACGKEEEGTPTGESAGATTNITESTNDTTEGNQNSTQGTTESTTGGDTTETTESPTTTPPTTTPPTTTPPATTPPTTTPPTTQSPTTKPSVSNDTTPPVVTSVKLDKTSASIGQTINITVAASDESEIEPIRFCFRMSNGKTGNAWTDLYKGTDGLFHGSIKIDETFVSGRCSFGWMQVDDCFSNSTLYSDGNGDYPDIYFDVVQ